MFRTIFAMLLLAAVISIALPTLARGAPPGDKQIAQHVVMADVTVQTEQDLTAVSGILCNRQNSFAGSVKANSTSVSKDAYNVNDESPGAPTNGAGPASFCCVDSV